MTKKYKISTYGYGGEVVMGFIKPEAYQYFLKNKINLENYALDSEEKINVPDKFRPFFNNQWYECDSIAHNSNVEMHNESIITIENENGDLIWKSNLSISTLDDAGCEVDNSVERFVEDYAKGTVIFIGKTIEKGDFFSGEINTSTSFNHKKLKFTVININGWEKINKIEYEGKVMSDLGDGSTQTKSSSFEFHVSKTPWISCSNEFKKTDLTDWFSFDIEPFREGLYEVEFSNGRLGSVLASWTGSEFIETASYDPSELLSPISISSIKHWRGLKSSIQ